MSILNIGSVNIDHVYRITTHPTPGETVMDKGYQRGLGGKGANMSLAASAGGARVLHAGAIGTDGDWCRARIKAAGIDVTHLSVLPDHATGHGVISVDDQGENAIIVHSGANRALTVELIDRAIAQMIPGDWLLLQNETNLVPHAAKTARSAGLTIAYAAAPFDPAAAEQMIGLADLIAVNEIEAGQLAAHLGSEIASIDVAEKLVTLGSRGAVVHHPDGETRTDAFKVEPVDTTGAGDTFFGFYLAGLDQGLPRDVSLRRAAAAAAIQVTRPGAGDAIPTLNEVEALIA